MITSDIILHHVLMQYKYLVDDVWRVDEEQHYVGDGFGMINNVVYVEETRIVSPSLPAQPLPQNPVVLSLSLSMAVCLPLFLSQTQKTHTEAETVKTILTQLSCFIDSCIQSAAYLVVTPTRVHLQVAHFINLCCSYQTMTLMFCVIVYCCNCHLLQHMT